MKILIVKNGAHLFQIRTGSTNARAYFQPEVFIGKNVLYWNWNTTKSLLEVALCTARMSSRIEYRRLKASRTLSRILAQYKKTWKQAWKLFKNKIAFLILQLKNGRNPMLFFFYQFSLSFHLLFTYYKKMLLKSNQQKKESE